MLITYQSTLLEKKEIAPHILLLKCKVPDRSDWTFSAGQYMIIHVPQTDGHPVRRLYSIASHPSQQDHLDFIIEIVPNGVGSNYVAGLNIGDMLTLQGAAGLFTYRASTRPPLFIATGTGIAPMKSILFELGARNEVPAASQLLWGLKHAEDIYLLEEFKQFQSSNSAISIKICLSREEHVDEMVSADNHMITTGRVTAQLDVLHAEDRLNGYDYYLCGGKHVVEALREYLSTRAVPDSQVFFEKFT